MAKRFIDPTLPTALGQKGALPYDFRAWDIKCQKILGRIVPINTLRPARLSREELTQLGFLDAARLADRQDWWWKT